MCFYNVAVVIIACYPHNDSSVKRKHHAILTVDNRDPVRSVIRSHRYAICHTAIYIHDTVV